MCAIDEVFGHYGASGRHLRRGSQQKNRSSQSNIQESPAFLEFGESQQKAQNHDIQSHDIAPAALQRGDVERCPPTHQETRRSLRRMHKGNSVPKSC